MTIDRWSAAPVPVPPESAIRAVYAHHELADAFRIGLPAGTSTDPVELARFVFGNEATWVRVLLRVRDRIVSFVGLKTSRELREKGPHRESRIGIFKVYAKSSNEVLMGEDDRHLDFRVSVLRQIEGGGAAQSGASEASLTVSTVVSCHNRLGRIYILCIAPFHRLVVRSYLQRAARAGWPAPARPLMGDAKPD